MLLLASDHLDKTRAAVHEVRPGLVVALAAGEGPSRNPKHQPNEDSLGASAIPGGAVAVVADSHWGARAGEVLVQRTMAALERSQPRTAEDLAALLIRVDLEAREGRPEGDFSETTLLAAVLRGRQLLWASVADSHLYAIATAARRLNSDLHLFAGAPRPLTPDLVESGEVSLARGEVVLLASDGIAEEDSGIATEGLAPLDVSSHSVRRLVDRARSSPGGRDNVALVALDPERLAR